MVDSISLMPIVLLALGLGHEHLARTGLIYHINCLVWQLAIIDIFGRKLHRRLDRVLRVADLVELLEIGLQALHDLDRVRHGRLVHVDLLEAADQRPVLLEILAVFLVGGRTDAAQRALRQRRLEQVGGVHRAARGRARADHGMDLVDEEDRVLVRLDLLHHLLQSFLEIAAIARAGEQRAHVEGEHRRAGQHLGHLVLHDLARETLGDGGLADAGIADQQRIVLLAAAQHLDRALDLGLAADQRIDAAVARLAVEVDAISLEGGLLLLAVALSALLIPLAALVLFVRAPGRLGFGEAGALGDAVADVVDGVVARHVLLLQEIGGVALPLREDRDEHVGAGHFLAAGRLHVDHRALDNALEAGGGLRVLVAVGHEIFEIAVDIAAQRLAQGVEIDGARPHHGRRILIVDQAQQQMLKGRIFVAAFVRGGQRTVERLFEIAGEGRHRLSPIAFP